MMLTWLGFSLKIVSKPMKANHSTGNIRWRGQFRCRGLRHESAVAQLAALGHLTIPVIDDDKQPIYI
jgi:hypothetical protein